jgi:hypothetical protein
VSEAVPENIHSRFIEYGVHRSTLRTMLVIDDRSANNMVYTAPHSRSWEILRTLILGIYLLVQTHEFKFCLIGFTLGNSKWSLRF